MDKNTDRERDRARDRERDKSAVSEAPAGSAGATATQVEALEKASFYTPSIRTSKPRIAFTRGDSYISPFEIANSTENKDKDSKEGEGKDGEPKEAHPFDSSVFMQGLLSAGYLSLLDVSRKKIKTRFVHALTKQNFAKQLDGFLDAKGLKKRGEYMVRFVGQQDVHSPFVHVYLTVLPSDHQTIPVAPKGAKPTLWAFLRESEGVAHWSCKAKGFWPLRIVFEGPSATKTDTPNRDPGSASVPPKSPSSSLLSSVVQLSHTVQNTVHTSLEKLEKLPSIQSLTNGIDQFWGGSRDGKDGSAKDGKRMSLEEELEEELRIQEEEKRARRERRDKRGERNERREKDRDAPQERERDRDDRDDREDLRKRVDAYQAPGNMPTPVKKGRSERERERDADRERDKEGDRERRRDRDPRDLRDARDPRDSRDLDFDSRDSRDMHGPADIYPNTHARPYPSVPSNIKAGASYPEPSSEPDMYARPSRSGGSGGRDRRDGDRERDRNMDRDKDEGRSRDRDRDRRERDRDEDRRDRDRDLDRDRDYFSRDSRISRNAPPFEFPDQFQEDYSYDRRDRRGFPLSQPPEFGGEPGPGFDSYGGGHGDSPFGGSSFSRPGYSSAQPPMSSMNAMASLGSMPPMGFGAPSHLYRPSSMSMQKPRKQDRAQTLFSRPSGGDYDDRDRGFDRGFDRERDGSAIPDGRDRDGGSEYFSGGSGRDMSDMMSGSSGRRERERFNTMSYY